MDNLPLLGWREVALVVAIRRAMLQMGSLDVFHGRHGMFIGILRSHGEEELLENEGGDGTKEVERRTRSSGAAVNKI
jgi:hypothetical protein